MKTEDIDDMKKRLRNHGNGAHVHTANKASMYIGHKSIRDETRMKLAELIARALGNDEGSELEHFMRRWW